MRWRLRNGLLSSVAVLGLAGLAAGISAPALADGEPNAKATSPGVRSLLGARAPGVNSSGGVLVDYSVLDSLARSPALLIPLGGGEIFDDAPVVLRPPTGVASTLVAPQKNVAVKLRPPPGVRTASAPKPVVPVRTARLTESAPKAITPPPATAAPAPPAPAVPAPAAAAPPATPAAASSAPTPAPQQPAPKVAAPAAPAIPAPAIPPPAAPAKAAGVTPPTPPAATAKPAPTPTPSAPPAAQPVPAQAKPATPPPTAQAQTAAATPAPAATPKPAPAATTALPATPPPVPAPTVSPQTAAAPPTPAPSAGVPRSLLTPPQETKVAVLPPPAAAPAKAAATAAVPPASVQATLEKIAPPPEAKAVETTAAASKPDASKPAEAKTAALSPATVPTSPDTFTISFAVGVPDVPADAGAGLRALAARLKADAALRVQLVAFASDPEKSVSRSRRLSTERAVNVRRQLLAAGVDSSRIDVRALGELSGDGAPDRVDAITMRR